jgi:hypothetical protein
MKKDGTGWAGWSLGRFVEKSCTACTKRGDSCLRVVVNDFGDIDLGACVWCKACSVGCSTAQRRGRQAKTKVAEEPKDGKRKASEVDSGASEAEEPSPKKVKSRSVIEDSEEEWEEWEGIEDKGDWPQESGEGQEAEAVREVTGGWEAGRGSDGGGSGDGQEGGEEREEGSEEVREEGEEAEAVREVTGGWEAGQGSDGGGSGDGQEGGEESEEGSEEVGEEGEEVGEEGEEVGKVREDG